MPNERYYIDETLSLDLSVNLKGTEFHHLARVMRSQMGDAVELINGKGVLAEGVITSLDKNSAVIRLEKISEEKNLPTKIILAQALPKINRLDFILEKGTELGVDEFWLFPGQQSIKKDFSENQMERAKAITIAAMKQCGRLTLPPVKLLPTLNQWTNFENNCFFGDIHTHAPLFLDAWKPLESKASLTFFIGPESGWSLNEINLFKKQDVTGVKLHDHILRTDTASLVALSLIRYQLLSESSKSKAYLSK